MEELFVLLDQSCGCIEVPNNIGANTQEMLTLYKEEFPYSFIDTIDGQCILWNQDFIDKLIVSMATGSLQDLSDIEKQVWYAFVEFQDSTEAVQKERQSKSLDTYFMDLLNCNEPNNCGIIVGDITDISPCVI